MAEEKKVKGFVLVTGSTGFLAGWVVRTLLEHGYRVRGTVRNLNKKEKFAHLEAMAEALGVKERLEFVEADLMKDEGWKEAVEGCEGVFHVASPFPAENPKDEQELIKPAVEGTTRVLAACAETKGAIKKVVVTSSLAAVERSENKGIRNEDDWSVVEKCPAYEKSKTLAERSVWEFVEKLPEEKKFAVSVINPGLILGPCLVKTDATSFVMVTRMMNKSDPGVPPLAMPLIDVRDCALAHVRAFESPAADGKRFVCCSGTFWMLDYAHMLEEEFAPQGYKIATNKIPAWVLCVVSICDKTISMVMPRLNVFDEFDNSQLKDILKVELTEPKKTLVDTAYSLIYHGFVKNKLDADKFKTPEDFHIDPVRFVQ